MPGRYQFSLPERRQRDGWFRLGSFDITTTAFMVLLGVVSMFIYAASQATLVRLVFDVPDVRNGEIWRLLTWPIANPPTQIWVILTLVFFWFFGHRIEDVVGRKRFTWLILAMTVIPAALVTALNFSSDAGLVYGLSALGSGLLVIFALDNPGAMFFFNIPAWIIALVFVGIDVLSLLGDRRYAQLVLELLVIAVGLVGARQYGMVEALHWIPNLSRKGGTRTSTPARTPKRAKPARRQANASSVITGPWAAPGQTETDQIELDMLLDKISASGIASLTKGEKQRLNDLSKRLRGS
ncbi:MAG: rhomboid family intramembrane serine protease [Ilumatobacteraceae bacterium]